MQVARHCHYATDCVPGWITNELGDREWMDCYPTWRSEEDDRHIYDRSKRSPRGKPCSQVTDQEIYDCLSSQNSVGAGNLPGSNCQVDTTLALSRCCLSSCWKPAWYGVPPVRPIPPKRWPPKRNRCARGHWKWVESTKEGYSYKVWVCDEYYPDHYENDSNGEPWIPPQPYTSPWNPIVQ